MDELAEKLSCLSTIVLSDGKKYVATEPTINDRIDNPEFSEITNWDKLKEEEQFKLVRKLTYIVLKDKHTEFKDEIEVGRLITWSMLNEGSEFIKQLLSAIRKDGGSEKNGVARE